MERPPSTILRIGAWRVNPASGQMSREGETVRADVRADVRTMRLLLCLAEHAGEVVSIDELLSQVWPEVTVSPDSVYQAVTSLRRLLGDDPKQPTYIETVPRLGYRMVAKVSPEVSVSEDPVSAFNSNPASAVAPTPHTGKKSTDGQSTAANRRASFTWAISATLCLAVVAAVVFLFHGKASNTDRSVSAAGAAQSQRSIAVLPFLDLTEGMKEEEFADGMTEELIDKLSKVPGLKVPSPTSSFYFKGKQVPITEMTKALGVAYVLDGSVRKSGGRVRVAARLIRAENGYVNWTETYDRPFDDIIKVQDDIAGKVTKALKESIEARPNR